VQRYCAACDSRPTVIFLACDKQFYNQLCGYTCAYTCIQPTGNRKLASSEQPDGVTNDDDVIHAAATGPSLQPLTHACRCRLRRHLVTTGRVVGLLSAVAYLPLPPALQRFLLLDELDTVH